MIRWNANFVRGLAQSVLERARLVRNSLTAAAPEKSKQKKAVVKRARPPRRPRTNG